MILLAVSATSKPTLFASLSPFELQLVQLQQFCHTNERVIHYREQDKTGISDPWVVPSRGQGGRHVTLASRLAVVMLLLMVAVLCIFLTEALLLL